jgi:hypothetical protein
MVARSHDAVRLQDRAAMRHGGGDLTAALWRAGGAQIGTDKNPLRRPGGGAMMVLAGVSVGKAMPGGGLERDGLGDSDGPGSLGLRGQEIGEGAVSREDSQGV